MYSATRDWVYYVRYLQTADHDFIFKWYLRRANAAPFNNHILQYLLRVWLFKFSFRKPTYLILMSDICTLTKSLTKTNLLEEREAFRFPAEILLIRSWNFRELKQLLVEGRSTDQDMAGDHLPKDLRGFIEIGLKMDWNLKLN